MQCSVYRLPFARLEGSLCPKSSAAALLVKVLCVPQAYHLHDLGKKHNFASHLLIEIERRAEQFDCRRPLCNKRQCICGPANTSVLRNPVALKFKPVANIIY
jgi:hypothetical protein